MSKPLGLTMFMQPVIPSKVEDRIWDAVQEAIASDWTPKRFVSEAQDAWAEALRNLAKEANEEFNRLLKS